MFTGLWMSEVAIITMLLLCGPLQSHDPGLHPWIRTLSPRSYDHSIDCGYSHPEALRVAYQWSPVPGTLSALLSQRYYPAARVGYLLGLYLDQAASCLCECVYVVDTDLSGLTTLYPISLGPLHLETTGSCTAHALRSSDVLRSLMLLPSRGIGT